MLCLCVVTNADKFQQIHCFQHPNAWKCIRSFIWMGFKWLSYCNRELNVSHKNVNKMYSSQVNVWIPNSHFSSRITVVWLCDVYIKIGNMKITINQFMANRSIECVCYCVVVMISIIGRNCGWEYIVNCEEICESKQNH